MLERHTPLVRIKLGLTSLDLNAEEGTIREVSKYYVLLAVMLDEKVGEAGNSRM